jgi:hypothetical protein
MRKISVPVYGLFALVLASCSTLKIEHVDYAWPVEFVSTASQSNIVTADRYGLSFSVANVAAAEFQDSSALAGSQIRLLRNHEGYYFLTGPKFKHVYVFTGAENALVKESVIEVSATGLSNPALNLRTPYVELLDGEGFRKLLTRSDIVEGPKQ